ncbi:hypothetical protein GWI33_003120 [Rhynchophorus ferrugineus]|uniref:Anaphase-promoting complex subunit 4 n=1 Tax=Rhynchophorus ferrugineus TaxID=354439 RepID=A0A834IJT4_RHYFE|nr:hypothetical protein GWI33_003120 [Rhynchophorus ferrugineus]
MGRQVIGLDSGQIQKAIRSNGAFVIKASEMQQIINHSVINYKAFFRWLYASIMRLMEEQVPSDIQKMTQQNLSCIAEFLQHFDNYGSGYRKGSTFIMERIGQYMVDSDLTIKPDMTGNEWTQLLEENQCLKMHEGILQHYLDKSLIQVFNEMKKNVEGVFETPTEKISQQLTPIGKFLGMSIQPNLPKPTSFNTSSNTVLMATQSSSRSIYLFDVGFGADSNCQIRCGNIFFTDHALYESNFDDAFKVVDAKFYSSSILSVLLQDTSRPDVSLIVQLLLVPLLKQLKEIDTSININEQSITQIDSRLFGQDIMKYLDMPVSAFSVSGSRRVCIVLGETKRKIKLYEMECEEDEEEDTEMTSMVKDESMQDSYSMASGE